MAVGKAEIPTIHPVKGIKMGTTEAGIKYANRRDLVVFEIADGAVTAGVFTLNRFCAAPVQIAKDHLSKVPTKYFCINTGYANAGTGKPGYDNALAVCAAVAEQGSVPVESVLPFSTGVIGETLPVDKIKSGLPKAFESLSEEGWLEASHGIMTTDTRPKIASCQFEYQGETITITGITKGAGMIKPNMATMLGFIATDISVDQPLLQRLLKEAVDYSFNSVTVDGDTSTNDACMLVATCQSKVELKEGNEELLMAFQNALNEVALSLAQALIRDGEGATKFVEIRVEGANSYSEAKEVAYTIAHSPLVKTALFAGDPNWGRILAAIGRAPGMEDLDVDQVNVWLDDVSLVDEGGLAASYREADGAAVMKKEEILIRVNLGRGQESASVWTTDFSYDYVKINAEYRS